VGSSLALAFTGAGNRVLSIYDGNLALAKETAERVGAEKSGTAPPEGMDGSNIVLLAVPDSEIRPLASRLADCGFVGPGQIVCHASGLLPAAELSPVKRSDAVIASMHPMFSLASRFSALPAKPYFGLEGEPEALIKLRRLTADSGWSAVELKPEQKALYHACCVLATGMNTALLGLSQKIFQKLGFGAESLGMVRSLASSAAANMVESKIADAVTGPLIRGEAGAVARHLEALDKTDLQAGAVYRALGRVMLEVAEERMDSESMDKIKKLLA
jgi:predicted short-subunit dehydrogenase-like oxidoreductase (DUF2520 family)